MTWQDELPPIPADRMLSDVVGEGRRRVERRRRNRRRATYIAGLGAAATLLLLAGNAGMFESDDSDQASSEAAEATAAAEETTAQTTAAAAATTAATADTAATEDTIGEASTGTTSPAAADTTARTEAPAGTEAAAAETTVPPGRGSIRPSFDVVIEPVQIWEQPATGPPCGPMIVEVRYEPGDRVLASATVLWSGPFGIQQAPMAVVDNMARAEIGPFESGTVTDPQGLRVFVVVTAVDAGGRADVLRPPVEAFRLNDC
jgi:hypothetical protein